MRPVRFGLVGVSGIGGYHRQIMHEWKDIDLVAVAERYPEREAVAPNVAQVRDEWKLPVYHDIWEMLDAVDVEAVTLAVPHHWHAEYTLGALDRGLHVLCEKPVTVVIQDGFRVRDRVAETGLHVAVDFQYTSYPHSLKLKEMICSGEIGDITAVVGVVEWLRTDEYYRRGDWTGKRIAEGRPCWDGVLENQAVHLVNSALQFATTAPTFAAPTRITGECYAVHPEIEVEDLAAVRAELDSGATLAFYATTCADADRRTSLDIIGTRGTATWDTDKAVVKRDGRDDVVLEEAADRDAIHKNLCACIRGEATKLYAPAAEAIKATMLINGTYSSSGKIKRLSWEDINPVHEVMDRAADERKLFSEMAGVAWAEAGQAVDMTKYERFEGLADG